MKNKLRIIILVVVIVLQILLPVGMIIYENVTSGYTTEKGEIFRFRLERVTCSEYSIIFSVENPTVWGVKYAVLENDQDGFAVMTGSNKKPSGNNYIKSKSKRFDFPVNTIETDEFKGKLKMITLYSSRVYSDLEKADLDGWREMFFKEAYVEAYVYKGEVVPIAVYVEGLPLKEFVVNQNLSG